MIQISHYKEKHQTKHEGISLGHPGTPRPGDIASNLIGAYYRTFQCMKIFHHSAEEGGVNSTDPEDFFILTNLLTLLLYLLY